MTQKGVKRQGNYPEAKYRYKSGDTKHPQEKVTCELCGVEAWVKKGSRFCSKKCAQTGSNNSVWNGGPTYQGTHASYIALHRLVRRRRGKASEYVCSCGKAAQEWANLTGQYADIMDYEAKCIRCHRSYDATRRATLE